MSRTGSETWSSTWDSNILTVRPRGNYLLGQGLTLILKSQAGRATSLRDHEQPCTRLMSATYIYIQWLSWQHQHVYSYRSAFITLWRKSMVAFTSLLTIRMFFKFTSIVLKHKLNLLCSSICYSIHALWLESEIAAVLFPWSYISQEVCGIRRSRTV